MTEFQVTLIIFIMFILAWSMFDYTKEKEREDNDIHDRD